MKAYWRVEVYLHTFFDLDTRWRLVVSFTPPAALPLGKEPLIPPG